MVSVVAVGCHPDDVEGGCFGTLALYRKRGANVTILLLTGGELGGNKDLRLQAAKSASSSIGATLVYADFMDGNISDDAQTVTWIEKEVEKAGADIVFAHCPSDRHQDHRNAGNATVSASRNIKNILLYETASTVNFTPQVVVDISETIEEKLQAFAMHKSEKDKETACEAIRCLAKYRAWQLRQPSAEVEAFQAVKWTLNP